MSTTDLPKPGSANSLFWLSVIAVSLTACFCFPCGFGAGWWSKDNWVRQNVDGNLEAAARMDVARSQVKSLSNICDQYRIKNQEFPRSLDALLQKDPNGNLPLIEDPNALKDPWGKAYQYDARGNKNQGRHADIWTVSPFPDNEEIGNWPRQKK